MSTKKAIRWLLPLILVSVAGFSQSATGRRQKIEAHSRLAKRYLDDHRPDLAIPEFRAIIAIDPNNVDARGNLGVLEYFQNDYLGAIPDLKAALNLKPDLWKVQALLGMAERRTGDAARARRDMESAFPNLSEKKIKIDAGMELIEIYSQGNDLDKAAATVSELRRLYQTNVEVLYTSYRIYSDLADEALLSLSVTQPKSPRMHQAMAHELARNGHGEDAIANYREALKLDPNIPGLHFELAEMLNASDIPAEKDKAVEEYEAALAANPSDEKSECRLGDIAAAKGDTNTAAQHYTRALQLQPNDAEANIDLAKILMQENQIEKAEPLLKHAVELDPTNATAHFRLSTVYRQSGHIEEAKLELEAYQKYKKMKEKLQEIYQEMRKEKAKQPSDELDSHNLDSHN